MESVQNSACKSSKSQHLLAKNVHSEILNNSAYKKRLEYSAGKNKLNSSLSSQRNLNLSYEKKSSNNSIGIANKNGSSYLHRKKYKSKLLNSSDIMNINTSQDISAERDISSRKYTPKVSPGLNIIGNENNGDLKLSSTSGNIKVMTQANNRTKVYEDKDVGQEENFSKRIADIIEKTKDILNNSCSGKKHNKHDLENSKTYTNEVIKEDDNININKNKVLNISSTKNKEQVARNSIVTKLKCDENTNSNINQYDSDYEKVIKPKAFNYDYNKKNSAENREDKENKSKSRKKKLIKKSKSKSKPKIIKNEYENLLTFTNENNLRTYSNALNTRIETTSHLSTGKKRNSNAINFSTNHNNITSSLNTNRLITRNNRSFSNNNISHKSKGKFTNKNDKEKILQLKERNTELKINLKNERKKNEELIKKMSRTKFKEENFNLLENNFLLMQKEFEKLQKNFNQSELIRKEQAKLIKSMQVEIDLLKENHNK